MLEILQQMDFVPSAAGWEITRACNMNCRHCGSRAGRRRKDELSTEKALGLCKDLAEAGCATVHFTGGEPLLRRDWPLLARALKEREICVSMSSNGRLFSREVAHQAKEAGICCMTFSIDGLEENHTYIRQTPGHWSKVLQNFAICREVGLDTGAVTTICQRNKSELRELHQLLVECKVPNWRLQLAVPMGNMADYQDLLLQPEDVLELIPLLAELRKLPGLRLGVGHNVGYYGGYEADLRADRDDENAIPFWSGCFAGCSLVGIESNGNIKGCCNLAPDLEQEDAFVEGNIRERPFHEIWNNPNAFAYNRKFKVEDLPGFCRTCEHAEVCRGGCPTTTFAFARLGSSHESRYCYHRLLKGDKG